MTIWRPDLTGLKGPEYQRLADAIARDILSGTLQPGDRLPPQRDLADSLAVTLGTVTRAYQVAARRGLVAGEVGRGTYILAHGGGEDGPLDLSLNALPPHAHLSELAARLDPLPGAKRTALLEYPPRGGHDAHRAVGAEWVARRYVSVPASQVLVTVGAQHALFCAMAAVASPGDRVLVEELTYSGVLAVARTLGLQVVPVGLDDQGLRADALDTACETSGARVLVAQPALHNPTGVSMTPGRRRQVLDVARRRGLTIVEDDTYGFLVPDARPLVADLDGPWAYVTGLSKSLAAGYRTGLLATSAGLVEHAATALWSSAVAASPIAADLAFSLVSEGVADRIVEWKRREVRARVAIARDILPQVPAATSPATPHVWLPLVLPWRSAPFANAARARGVILGASESFMAHPGATPRAIRVCLMPPRSRDRLREGLAVLGDLAAGGVVAEMTV